LLIYLHGFQAEFRASVDKAKGEMRELWNLRTPAAAKGKKKPKKK